MHPPPPAGLPSDGEISSYSPLSSDLDSDDFSPMTRKKCHLPSAAGTNSQRRKPTKTPKDHINNPPPAPQPRTESIIWTDTLLADLTKTIDSTFPWERFAFDHNLNPDLLRHTIRELVITPLCLRAEGRLQEFFDRVRQYDLARKEYRKHVCRQERQEARDLREHDKMRSKEIWKENKARLKKALEDLEAQAARGGDGCASKAAAVKGQKALIAQAKRQRVAQKAREKMIWKAKWMRIPDIRTEESAEEEV
ncbi:MAG: hypothetical protein Q9219_004766 [cf. Caloplaca sp. 3 TL-2023]